MSALPRTDIQPNWQATAPRDNHVRTVVGDYLSAHGHTQLETPYDVRYEPGLTNHLPGIVKSTIAASVLGWAALSPAGSIPAHYIPASDTGRIRALQAHGTNTMSGTTESDPTLPGRAASREAIRRQLRSFSGLPTGWDGYQGAPAAPSAANDALAFLSNLPVESALPRPGLSGDGEIGLFWDYLAGFIDIGFSGNGLYSFYAEDANGNKFYGDDISLGARIPGDLLGLISKYA